MRHSIPAGELASILIVQSTCCWPISRGRGSLPWRSRGPPDRGRRLHGAYRRTCGGQCGAEIKGVAPSRAPGGGVEKRRFSSSTTSGRSRLAASRPWTTSSCAAARTISTRPTCSLAENSSFAKAPRSTRSGPDRAGGGRGDIEVRSRHGPCNCLIPLALGRERPRFSRNPTNPRAREPRLLVEHHARLRAFLVAVADRLGAQRHRRVTRIGPV